jgi:hypothetical protein
MVTLAPLICVVAESLPRSVLVITQSSPTSAGAVALVDGIRFALNVSSTQPVTIYTEHLDLNRFPTPQHKDISRNYLREKYREDRKSVV